VGLGGLITALAATSIAWFQRGRPVPVPQPSAAEHL